MSPDKSKVKDRLVYRPIVLLFEALWKWFGLKFKFFGTENIPTTGGAIIASNHISYLDFALIGTPAVPKKRYIRFMAKKEIFDNKIAGPLMRGMGHISVDRDKGSTSLVAAMRALRAGELVGIFPEATISLSWEVKEIKSGAIRLAQGAGVPVIPVALWGSQRVLTKGHKPQLGRSKVAIYIAYGEPYLVAKDADVIQEEVRLHGKISALLQQLQESYPDSPVGHWWGPARLGGTAPTLEQAQAESARRKALKDAEREEGHA